MSFERWLRQCARLAMGAEWCINEDMPEWKMWYAGGLTPERAVEMLWHIVDDH